MPDRKHISLLNTKINDGLVLSCLLICLLVTGCAQQTVNRNEELTVVATETVTPLNQEAQPPEKVVLSGRFVRTFGDPPEGKNGGARIVYTLTTSEGKDWILIFDKDWRGPASGRHKILFKQVVVEGLILSDGRVLVESLELPQQ